MYISSLEILGFKSFPLKTKIDFSSGVTGVVGPNGCGKTNILDSLRWVMGEQRYRVLRGAKMEDVIFSGTKDLKALGMAEVSLTIINDKHVLPTDYSTVTITRRLHRSGDSEYLLNNKQCRLKDITELFADTGMGAHAYSVIELAMVEAILSDKAEERRFLFDEAAGITKYKTRKAAALRKLEATETDLLRLFDILAEVSGQVRSLNRQMKKAERYQYLTEKIKTNSLLLLKDNLKKVQDQLDSAAEQKRNGEVKVAQSTAEINKWEMMRQEILTRSVEVADQLREVRQGIEKISNEYHRSENDFSVAVERIAANERTNENDLSEIANLEIKIEQLTGEIDSAGNKLIDLKSMLENSQTDVSGKETLLVDKMKELERYRNSSQQHQQDLFEIEGKKNLKEQSSQELGLRISEVKTVIGIEETKLEKIAAEKQTLEQELAANDKQLEDLAQRVDYLSETVEESESNRAEYKIEIEQVWKSISECRLEIKSIETHVELQEQMIAHYEGYGSGVSSLFAKDNRFEGVIDTIANLLEPDEKYLKQIELALGEVAEYVLVQERDTALRAIEHLQQENMGRVTFLINSEVEKITATEKDSSLSESDGFICWADDVVSSQPEYKKMAHLLLGNMAIVRDYQAGKLLIEKADQEIAVITMDGHLLRTSFLQEGGSEKTALLLGRDLELGKLKDKLEIMQERSNHWEERKNSLQLSLEDTERKLRELTLELESKRAAISNYQLQFARYQEQRKQIMESELTTGNSLKQLQEKLATLLSSQEQIDHDSSKLAGDTDEAANAFKLESEKLTSLQQETAKLSREHEQLRFRVMSQKTELKSLEENIRRNEQLNIEMLETKTQRNENLQQHKLEIIDLTEANKLLKNNLEDFANKKDELRNNEAELSRRESEILEKQSEYEELVKSSRKEHDQVSEDHHQVMISVTELNSRFDELKRNAEDDFDIDVRELTLAESLADEIVQELEEELNQAREKQRSIGMVNMLALEEYERESEREKFLSKQINDLTSAKDNLKATINRINSTARKLFLETFEEARENFRKVFTELFQGGEADIRLEDDTDPLESSIIISARPRGKKMLGVSQLSGGEKALTAISLLFGIYLVKPSPFCVLDEVDAPLDDANVGRFLDLVKTFSERTQFIVITHNKKTMEQCARLYGVTMGQPGVSQIVSVDFAGLDREGKLDLLRYPSKKNKSVVGENRIKEHIADNPEIPEEENSGDEKAVSAIKDSEEENE